MNARRAWVGLGILLLIVTGCGSPSGPQVQSSNRPMASPAASAGPVLFAVEERSSPTAEASTIAIVGLDGKTRVEAPFLPRRRPVVPDAYVQLQGVAQVVGSRVYYMDGNGTVSVLDLGKQPHVVARFAVPPTQAETWFAVSPDGTRVMAGILTLPALGPVIQGTSWNSLVGPWKFSLMTSVAGAAPTESLSGTWSDPPSTELTSQRLGDWWPTFPVGWTSAGPVAMYPVLVSSQNAWPGGPLQVLDLAPGGVEETAIGGADCSAAAIMSSGLIACISSGNVVSVRDSIGATVWTTHVDGFNATWLHVSPDGQSIADNHYVETRLGGMVTMPQGFRVEGWLDNVTVVGRITTDPNTIGGPNEGNLLWISLDHPAVIHDLGIKGDFVAMLA